MNKNKNKKKHLGKVFKHFEFIREHLVYCDPQGSREERESPPLIIQDLCVCPSETPVHTGRFLSWTRGDLASVRKRHCSPRCQGSSCVLKGLCSLLSPTARALLRWQTPGRHSPSQTLVPFSTKSGGAIRHHCQTALGIYLQEHSKSPNQSVIMVIPI